jgi:hypothetical protein
MCRTAATGMSTATSGSSVGTCTDANEVRSAARVYPSLLLSYTHIRESSIERCTLVVVVLVFMKSHICRLAVSMKQEQFLVCLTVDNNFSGIFFASTDYMQEYFIRKTNQTFLCRKYANLLLL